MHCNYAIYLHIKNWHFVFTSISKEMTYQTLKNIDFDRQKICIRTKLFYSIHCVLYTWVFLEIYICIYKSTNHVLWNGQGLMPNFVFEHNKFSVKVMNFLNNSLCISFFTNHKVFTKFLSFDKISNFSPFGRSKRV